MKISAQFTSSHAVRLLSASELELGVNVLLNNLHFQPGENILVVTDEQMRQKEAAIWFEAAKHLTQNVQLLVLTGMTHSGEEPPSEIIAAAGQANISFFHTFYSLTHTQAGKVIMKNNHRGFSLPGVNYEMMLRTLMADYTSVKKLGEKIKQQLEKAQTIRITSAEGTDLVAKVRQTNIYNDGGILVNGEIGNLPAGEVFFAPLLGSMNGNLVIDGSIADDELDSPIHLTIGNGIATHCTGGRAAEQLWRKLTEYGKKGCTAAEIGIGTNSETNPHGDLTEAEKAYGTIHIAFGNSSAIGGENDVPIHLDGVVLHPKVELDGQTLLADRKFVQ